jgi:tetratricopeptide (TPR) repeat protein
LREKASVIDLYSVLSDYLNRQQDHQRGEELDTLVLRFFETLSKEDMVGSLGVEFVRALGTAATRQMNLKQYESATRSYQQTLKMLETVELDMKQRGIWQATTYHNLGIIMQELRKWQEAGELLTQSLSIFQEYDDTHHSSIALNSLALLWQASNDASILERVASVLEMSREEVEKLLQEYLEKD